MVLATVSVVLLMSGCGGKDDREHGVIDGSVPHEVQECDENEEDQDGVYIKDWEDGGHIVIPL